MDGIVHQAVKSDGDGSKRTSLSRSCAKSNISNDPNFDDHGAVIFHGPVYEEHKHTWTRSSGTLTAVPSLARTRSAKGKGLLRHIFCCLKAQNHPSTSTPANLRSASPAFDTLQSRRALQTRASSPAAFAKPPRPKTRSSKVSFIEWLLPNTTAARRRRAAAPSYKSSGQSPFSGNLAVRDGRRLLNDFPLRDQNAGTGASTLFAHEKLLLPPLAGCDANKNCLIVDLDETLVHSSFKPIQNADFIVPVDIDGVVHNVYVSKRPHADEFLQRIAGVFECVMFTASLAKYADPVVDLLDRWRVFRSRLFREACVYSKGNYVKDLDRLGRDLRRVIIIDNSPASYAMHPENAIPVQSWFGDTQDTELLDLLPFLEKLSLVDNVYEYLSEANQSHTGEAIKAVGKMESANYFKK